MRANNINEPKVPRIKHDYENADADGNRGMWVTYFECPNCGCELSFEEDIDRCPECNQLLEVE